LVIWVTAGSNSGTGITFNPAPFYKRPDAFCA
jgi:hypothetical protein